MEIFWLFFNFKSNVNSSIFLLDKNFVISLLLSSFKSFYYCSVHDFYVLINACAMNYQIFIGKTNSTVKCVILMCSVNKKNADDSRSNSYQRWDYRWLFFFLYRPLTRTSEWQFLFSTNSSINEIFLLVSNSISFVQSSILVRSSNLTFRLIESFPLHLVYYYDVASSFPIQRTNFQIIKHRFISKYCSISDLLSHETVVVVAKRESIDECFCF